MKIHRNPFLLIGLAVAVICAVLVKLASDERMLGKESPTPMGERLKVDSSSAGEPEVIGGNKASERKPRNEFIQRWSAGETFTAEELLRHAGAVTLQTLPDFLSVAMAADIPGPQRSMLTSIAVAAVAKDKPIAEVMGAVMDSLPPGKIRNRCSLAAFELSSDSVGTLAVQMRKVTDASARESALQGLCFKLRKTRTLEKVGLTPALLEGEEGSLLMTTLGSRIGQEDPKNRQAAYEESYQLVRKATEGRDDGVNVLASFVSNASSSVPELAWDTWQSIEPSQRGEQAGLIESLMLTNLALKRPEATADQILAGKNAADTPRQLTTVLEAWIGSDNNAAEVWGTRTIAEMEPATLDAAASVFARFHLKKGANENAALWIEKISDPALKKQLGGQLK